jgi:hypothetical protein
LQAQTPMFDENYSRFELKKHTINHWSKPKRQRMKSSKRKWWWVLSLFQPKHKHTTFKPRAQVGEEDKIDVVTWGWTVRAKLRSLRWWLHLLGF